MTQGFGVVVERGMDVEVRGVGSFTVVVDPGPSVGP